MGQRVMIAMMLIPRAGPPDRRRADLGARRHRCRRRCSTSSTSWCATNGMGLILISHDLDLVARYCDRILVMNAGRVVEECAAGGLAHAQHPYTRGLLAAVPRMRRDARRAAGARPRRLGRAHERARPRATSTSPTAACRWCTASSFAVAEGESFALVGESGSGKSTVLKAIAGLAPDWTGADRGARPAAGARHRPRLRARRARWCSRTPTARCTRARPSTPR